MAAIGQGAHPLLADRNDRAARRNQDSRYADPISVNHVMAPAGIDDHGPLGQEAPLSGRQARQVEHDLLLSELSQVDLRCHGFACLPMGGHVLIERLANSRQKYVHRLVQLSRHNSAPSSDQEVGIPAGLALAGAHGDSGTETRK